MKKLRIGTTLSTEHKEKISIANKGKRLSDATKRKMSEAAKGRIPPGTKGLKHDIVTCPYCNKQGGKGAMIRYHFDNCKNKP